MTGPLWVELHSLGAPTPARSLIEGWLRALCSRPGTSLLLELGEDLGGPFLRARLPGELLPGASLGEYSPVRVVPREAPPTPSAPFPGETFAPGRILWPREDARTLAQGLSLGPRGARWCVQAFFQPSGPVGLETHLRLAAVGEPNRVELVRDGLGMELAGSVGAFYEPWRPGSWAARTAWGEWTSRTLRSFHSGTGAPASPERFSGVWVAPALCGKPPVAAGTMWRLGSLWRTGEPNVASDREMLRHLAVVGMTGAGKTQFLASLAGEAAGVGVPWVLFDLQGDLGPAALGRIPRPSRERLVVVDGARTWGLGRAGIDVLGSGETDRSEDLVSAELLAALRPTSGSGEEFWGPRMERILDSVVRSVWEAGGNLDDVASVLFDPARHCEAFARTARNDRIREFLEGLPALQRRQPDYLASSQNRLSHIALSRIVSALVSPAGRTVDVGQALEQGRSLVFYLPKGAMGEGPSVFAANLFLAHLFLTLSRRTGYGSEKVRALVLVDEVQNFSPSLVRSLLETGRKFGLAAAIATQSVERLEGAVGGSTLATLGSVFVLRTPPPSSLRALGLISPGLLPPEERQRLETTVATLPDHTALVRSHGSWAPEACRLPAPVPPDLEGWEEQRERSAAEFGNLEATDEGTGDRGPIEKFLLGVAAGERGGSLGREDRADPVTQRMLTLAERRGWVVRDPEDALQLTPLGWVQLGARENNLAPKETAEHRRLVLAAFRIFAKQGVRLEIPLQGRFDVRVPDARACLLSTEERDQCSPAELLARVQAQEGRWLWRLGRGRNVHVEAEVSSLHDLRRLHRSLGKAKRADAFLLFLAGTPEGGRKLRRFLRENEVPGERATVWVLRPGKADGPPAPDLSRGAPEEDLRELA